MILLIKRRDVPVWVLPGGGVEETESPEVAIVREVREETGLAVSIRRLASIYTPVNRLAHETYLYECSVDSGRLTTGDETRELRFFALDRLPHSFFFVHRDWLTDAQRNEVHIIRKPLTQVTYTALIKYFCRHPVHVLRFMLSRLGFPINS